MYRRLQGDFFCVEGVDGSGEGVTWEDPYMEEFIMREENFS